MKNSLIFLISICTLFLFACKKEVEVKGPTAPPYNFIDNPSLIFPVNDALYKTDTYLVFNWTELLDAKNYLLVFANDSAMIDTVKSFKLENNNIGVLLSSLGENYVKYWTVYGVDSNEKYNPISTVHKLIFDGFVKPTFVIKFISPQPNATIYKDEAPIVKLLWTSQPQAISYEIHLDYTPQFQLLNQGLMDATGPIKRIMVNAPDTLYNLYKHTFYWNTKMYIRIRAVYSAKLFSEWSETMELNVSDPRTNYIGDYNLKVVYIRNILGSDTTITYNNVPSTLVNVNQSGMLLQNSYINWNYNPFYFSSGTETYQKYKFYGNPHSSGRATGNMFFKVSANGDTVFVNGTYVESFPSGNITYGFSGFKQ
jgi:hypothetical protein